LCAVGTARAQLQLRRTLLYLDADLVGKPEVLVAAAHERFEDGRLADEESRGFLEELLGTFVEHIRGVRTDAGHDAPA
jgi:chromate reductase, NAD(P)H dehydrogenase (quinone)